MKRMLALCVLGAAFAAAALPAYANNDSVQFGVNIRVPQGFEVHDAVCFFCSVNIDGRVDGDVVVFFGNVHIAGQAEHDVVNFFGKVTADDNASIGHDLVSFFGRVQLGENVSVGQDLVAMFGSLHTSSSASIGHDRVVQPAWLFFTPLFVVALVLLVIIREFRAYRRRQFLNGYGYPPRP